MTAYQRNNLIVVGLIVLIVAFTLHIADNARADRVPDPRPATNDAPWDSCGDDAYENADGNCVPSPQRAPAPPAGASARCMDGTYSFSRSRSGTCSHHGGVASWL